MRRALLAVLLLWAAPAWAQYGGDFIQYHPPAGLATLTGTASATTSTVPFLFASGTKDLPGIAFSAEPDFGFYLRTAGVISITNSSGAPFSEWRGAAGAVVNSSGLYWTWTNGGADGSADTVMARGAAGIVVILGSNFSTGGALGFGGVTFAALGTPANGTITYCSDCAIADPCAGSGTGAIAKRLNGGWVCN